MTTTSATRTSMPRFLLRMEGLALFVASLILYAHFQFNGWALLLLFFSLDLFMVGYLRNAKLGSLVYNMGHTEVAPVLLALIGLALQQPIAIQFALIWFAHINFDRLIDAGLKYPTAFQDTHLQRV